MLSRLTVLALSLANDDPCALEAARIAQTDALLARVALLGYQRELRSEAANGNALRLKELLTMRIDPDTVDARGQAALHLAACNGDLKSVRLLLAFNADPGQLDGCNLFPWAHADGPHVDEIAELLGQTLGIDTPAADGDALRAASDEAAGPR
jgi:ankyrin repeat protein